MSRIAKIFAVAVVLVLASNPANAKAYLGGNFGLTDNANGLGFYLAPEIGAQVSPNLSVGAIASFYSNPMSMGVTPYARLQLLNIFNLLYIFGAVNVPVNFASNYLSIGMTVRPMVALRLGPKVALTAQIGNFGIVATGMNREISSSWIGRIDADNISVGITYNLWK